MKTRLCLMSFAVALILLGALACTGATGPAGPPGSAVPPIVAPPVTATPVTPPAAGMGTAGPYGTYGFGRDATADKIAAWNIDISPDGSGLPAGSGTPAQGATVFAAKCAGCHGDKGQGGLPATVEVLVGTQSWFQLGNPRSVARATIGNYWPYATTIYDYVLRAMPFNSPQSLSKELSKINSYM